MNPQFYIERLSKLTQEKVLVNLDQIIDIIGPVKAAELQQFCATMNTLMTKRRHITRSMISPNKRYKSERLVSFNREELLNAIRECSKPK